jgi:hypothetical protein
MRESMGFLTVTGRAWRDLPLVIILGLVIGGVFGELVKLISSSSRIGEHKSKTLILLLRLRSILGPSGLRPQQVDQTA